MFPIVCISQTQTENYIKTTIYKKPTTTRIATPTADQAIQTVTYFDGLGRPIQQVSSKQSGAGKNIITHIEYDAFGRQGKEYLPYPSTTASGLDYDPNAQYNTLNYSQYSGQNPLSEKLFDGSPLNRILKQSAPGTDWKMPVLANDPDHTIKFDYQTNIASGNDAVKLYQATAAPTAGLYDISLSQNGTYPIGQLYKTVTTDENNNITHEFKDKEGRIVLKRTFENSSPYETYYVYDQYGNLTYVIPPLATNPASTLEMEKLCYQYKYDFRNRLVEKKLPGKQWEFIVYDRLDRVIATGPSFSPFSNASPNTFGWMITKYDAFNRVVYTGWLQATVDVTARAGMQSTQNGLTTTLNETKTSSGNIDGISVNYSNVVSPLNFKLLTVNYYDDYNFPSAPNPIPSSVLIDNSQPVFYNNTTYKPKGLSTGSWIRILETTNDINSETSFILYDNKARQVRSYTANFIGGYTQVDSKIDFSGKTLFSETIHSYDRSTELLIKDQFTYTDQDRLSIQTQQIISDGVYMPIQLITSNTYDDLGQLISKNVGGDDKSGAIGLQKVDFSYNIRGWLKTINDARNLNPSVTENDLFAFKINYQDNDQTSAWPGDIVPQLYNGNISETFWKTSSDNILRKYGYEYDNVNRLINATYQKPDCSIPVPNSYNETITYDANGNITTLYRNGDRDSDDYLPSLPIDELQYDYDGNRLMTVYDNLGVPQGFNDGGTDFNSDGYDYAYDLNGNMTSDDNKEISSIVYNHLNLPTQIDLSSGKINYIYNANGIKVRKIIDETIVYDYMGGFQYKDNKLQFFPHAEGYVNYLPAGATSSESFNYVFNYTDHLGNIRLSYGLDPSTQKIKIIEENHYYPFGLKHTNYNSDQLIWTKGSADEVTLRKEGGGVMIPKPLEYKYKYNGKELQDELGLNMYDYGFRNYDPALGRWMNIDPLAETSRRFSPYTYCYNNPMRFTDPDGMKADDWIQRGKEYIYDSTVTTQEQATAIYGADANHLNNGSKIVATNGSYEYNLNSDGSVTDCGGATLDTSNDISTPGGSTILGQDSKGGDYYGVGIGGAVGGGISFEIGGVKDSTGNWGAYFSFGGNVGFSADAGIKMGEITPTGDNPFAISDFAGKSNSFSGGVGPMGGEVGGSDGSKAAGVNRSNPASWGQNDRGYEFSNAGPSILPPGMSTGVQIGAQYTGSKTWVFDF